MNGNTITYGNNNSKREKMPEEIAIIPNDSLWGEKLKNYQKSKDIFYYNKKDFPKIITKELILNTEEKFNPITQRYENPKKDNLISKSSKQRQLDFISNGYDKQLEVESTYNLINLSNKLKYFNYEEPLIQTLPNKNISKDKIKENQFNYETINKKPYNILTNLSLKDHNFVSPRLRPINSDSLIKSTKEGLSEFDKKNNKKEIERYKRDFNIINNEYKIFNKEKKDTEKEIQNLNAVKKMQNRKTYDILNCKYINPTLENEFIKNMKIKEKMILSKTKDKNYIIRNPINHIVYDKEAQKRLDDIEREKKKRYILHENIEKYYHSVGNNIETNKNEMALSHGNPLDLNVNNKRGYNIINGVNFIEEKINSKNKKDIADINMTQKKAGQYYDNWEKIKQKSDSNNTVNKKPIYKEPYDSSDVEKNFEKYLQNRKNTLLNNKNIYRSYGTFNNGEDNFNFKSNLGSTYNRNSYTAADDINRNNKDSYRKNSFGLINEAKNRIENKMKYDKMDKIKFFGNSFLIKK